MSGAGPGSVSGPLKVYTKFEPIDTTIEAYISILKNPPSEQAKLQAKAALKGKGIDIDLMRIHRENDTSSVHQVKLYAGKVGGGEIAITNVSTVLPTDAAKAEYLYAQRSLLFEMLGKPGLKYARQIETQHTFKPQDGATPPSLILESMKITKFLEHPGKWYNSFDWYRNIGREETWTAAQLSADADLAAAFTTHQQHMGAVSDAMGLMSVDQARKDIYEKALSEMQAARSSANTPNNVVPLTFLALKSQMISYATLPDTDKELLELLIQMEADNSSGKDIWGADKSRFPLLLDLMEKCRSHGASWDRYAQSDLDATKAPNLAKIQSIKDFLIDFADYCHLQSTPNDAAQPFDATRNAKINAFQQLRVKHNQVYETWDECVRMTSESAILNDDNEFPHKMLDIGKRAKNISQLDPSKQLSERAKLLRELQALEEKVKPYFIREDIVRYNKAREEYNTIAGLLFPNADASADYSGLVAPASITMRGSFGELARNDNTYGVHPRADDARRWIADIKSYLQSDNKTDKEREKGI